MSVPRGNPAVLTCNISNTFTDVTIQLSARGEDRTIFNKKPQGNFSWSGWTLQVKGGEAQLVIKAVQDDHAGMYLWQLHGRQRYYRNVTLNVSGEVRAVGNETGGDRASVWSVAEAGGDSKTGRGAEEKATILISQRNLICPGV